MDIAVVDSKNWKQDPETGLLDVDLELKDGVLRASVFDVALKLKFLNCARDVWPNLSLACRLSGISRQTLNNHLAIDKNLRDIINEWKDERIDGIESVRMAVAETPAGAFDRMAVLNAYRKEVYNPKTVIQIDQTVTHEVVLRRASSLGRAVEASLVKDAEPDGGGR